MANRQAAPDVTIRRQAYLRASLVQRLDLIKLRVSQIDVRPLIARGKQRTPSSPQIIPFSITCDEAGALIQILLRTGDLGDVTLRISPKPLYISS